MGPAGLAGGPTELRDGLRDHLSSALLERGRARLDEGDHLGALRLFSRLLCIDESNDEVLALVQDMHNIGKRPERSPLRIAGALAGMAAAALLTVALWPTPPAPSTTDTRTKDPSASPVPGAVVSTPREPSPSPSVPPPTAAEPAPQTTAPAMAPTVARPEA